MANRILGKLYTWYMMARGDGARSTAARHGRQPRSRLKQASTPGTARPAHVSRLRLPPSIRARDAEARAVLRDPHTLVVVDKATGAHARQQPVSLGLDSPRRPSRARAHRELPISFRKASAVAAPSLRPWTAGPPARESGREVGGEAACQESFFGQGQTPACWQPAHPRRLAGRALHPSALHLSISRRLVPALLRESRH